MTQPPVSHVDVAGYLLGSMTLEERAAFERHLADCPWCRRQLDELGEPAELLHRATPADDMPPGLEAATFGAIERDAPRTGHARRRRPVAHSGHAGCIRRRRRCCCRRDRRPVVLPQLDRPVRGGQIELEAVLVSPAAEYYEPWFIGPGDARRPAESHLGGDIPS